MVIEIGTRAWIPPVAGLADTPYWTNREAVETEEVPGSLTVLGGGAIGVELAQVFPRFGSEVTVLEAGPAWSVRRNPRPGDLLARVFAAEGIDVRTGVNVTSIHHDGRRFTVAVGEGAPVVSDRLLVATGRRADLAQLNASSIGVDEAARSLPVDDHMRVEGTEGVWAIGDVTGKGAFTHVSMYQADIVVNDILGRPVVPADYRAVPRVTFTDPEIGSVGMTESEARGQGLEVRVGTADASDLGPRMDPQGGQRRLHQAGRGRRTGGAGRCHVGGPVGRRGARPARPGRPRRGAHHPPPAHDLRLSDVPPGDRAPPSRTSSAGRRTTLGGRNRLSPRAGSG